MIAVLHSKKLRIRRLVELSLGETLETRHHAYYTSEKIEGQDRFSAYMAALFLDFILILILLLTTSLKAVFHT
jgi:hypothetical protein